MTPAIDIDTTLPRLLLRNARNAPKDAAMREKALGIWRTWSWAQYYDHVRDFANGLAALGFDRGDKLAVIGDNRPTLYAAQLAAQGLGGVPVPVYQDSIASELVYVLNHAEVAVIVAEDQEQVDKILSLREQLPTLKLLVFEDPRGMAFYKEPLLKGYAEVERIGREFAAKAGNADRFEREIAKGKASDIAVLAYTSGTTGNPKGAILTHSNMLHATAAFCQVEDVRRGDNWLSYLPMAWVGDSAFSLAMALQAQLTCNCPESPETVIRDLRELGPSAMLAPPRIWENMLTSLQVKAADASFVKRRVFEFFRSIAEQYELLRSEGKARPAHLRLWHWLGDFFVYGPVRDQLGLSKARWSLTGGAPLGADAFRFFRGFGINLKQVYGSTECSALIATQPDGQADPNTVGPPCPGIELKIDAGGEVLIKGPGVFAGYFKQDQATSEAIDAEGWFHTGDAGFTDPRGHLVIIDRAKDVGKLADGTPFAPQFIENKLKFSPFIREAVAFGNDRPYVCAMIAIDLNTVGNWAERRSLAYTSFTDLSQKPEVAALIAEEIAKCNINLPEAARVRRYLLLMKELEADDAEMTRTRKLRRKFVAEKYAAVIEAFYGGKREVELVADITFEDGRKSKLRSVVPIHDIAAAPSTARAA